MIVFSGEYLSEVSHKDGLWPSMHVLLCWPTHASLFASFAGCMGLRDIQGKHSRFRDLHLSIILQWDTGCVPRAEEQSGMLVLNNKLKAGSPLTC